MALWGNIIKDCPPSKYAIYDVKSGKVVKEGGLTLPTIQPGYQGTGFVSIETLSLPAGNYEYKVYVGSVLVAVFPFEVK
jgi:hypothetical protein